MIDLRGILMAPTIFGPNFLNTDRILTSLQPFESPESPLSNGSKLVKIRYILRMLGPKGGRALRPSKGYPTTLAHNFLNMSRILTSFVPFESPGSPLSNGAKLVEIRYILRMLGPFGLQFPKIP